MRVLFCVLPVLLIITATFAAVTEVPDLEEIKPSSQPNLEDAKIQEPDDISPSSQDSQDTEVTRKKKSTTTTFCVEIRPSNPYQKPFQVCEPAESIKPSAYPAQDVNYYAGPNYGVQDQSKTQVPYQPAASPAYKPASQQKPAPAYSAPVKTFSAPSGAPAQKPFPSHPAMSYSSYRSKNADSGTQEHNHDHTMRMTQEEEEEEDQSTESGSEQMRSAGYGSASYGAPTSFIPVVPKHKQKVHGHNGLVITCQPNLAGYAHNVPSSFHQPSPVSYNYRSAGARSYGGRGYGRYKAPPLPYGNIHQGPGIPSVPVLKPLVPVPSAPIPRPLSPSQSPYGSQHIATYGSQSAYEPQIVPHYSGPAYKSSLVYPSAAVSSHSYGQPLPPPPPMSPYGPSPVAQPQRPSSSASISSQASSSAVLPSGQIPTGYGPPQPYAPYSQSQSFSAQPALGPAPSSALGPVPAALGPAPPPIAPEYAPVPPPAPAVYGPVVPAPPPVVLPPPALPAPPAPPPPTYVAPGTYYRESEDETKTHATKATSHQMEKEGQTLKKMQEMSQQRAAGTQWNSEISTDSSQAKKTEEHVQATHQGWSSRTSGGEIEGVKQTDMEQDAKINEVDQQS